MEKLYKHDFSPQEWNRLSVQEVLEVTRREFREGMRVAVAGWTETDGFDPDIEVLFVHRDDAATYVRKPSKSPGRNILVGGFPARQKLLGIAQNPRCLARHFIPTLFESDTLEL